MRTLIGMLRLSFHVAVIAVAAGTGLCAAQETWFTNRATEMRSDPDDAAPVVQPLADKTRLSIVERRGGWSRVKLDGPDMKMGWVRAWHLRGGATVQVEQSSGGSVLGSLNRLFGGTSQPQRAQSATLGVRGLSPEELKAAAPNPEALAKVKSFAASKGDAEKYAEEVPLAKADIPDLPKDDSANNDRKGGRK